MNNITSPNSSISKALVDDWNNLLTASKGNVVVYLANKYPKAFTLDVKGHVILKDKYRGISDIISGLTGDNINLGFHHSAKYWSASGMLEKEAWAQFGRVYFDNDSEVVKMMKDIFTNFDQSAIMALKGVK